MITLAGGYGPRPLARAADVACEAGEAPSAEFREVLESIPVPQITEEVSFCCPVIYAPKGKNISLNITFFPRNIRPMSAKVVVVGVGAGRVRVEAATMGESF